MYLTNEVIKCDSLYKEYGELFTQQIERLETEIFKHPTGKEKFKVLGFEAGIGKSRYTDLIIKNYIEETATDKDSKKFLIVKKLNKDSKKTAQFINNTSWSNENTAVAIDRDNWREYWKKNIKKMKKVHVLLIAHARYINLCNDEKMRKNFIDGREIMIIDEKIQFQPLIYRDSLYSEVRKIIDFDERSLLDNVCRPLGEYLNQMNKEKKTRQVHKIRFEDREANVTELIKYLNDFVKKNSLSIKERNLIEALSEGLPYWFNNMNIYNNHNIATNSPKQSYWGAEGNNIILDASAKLDGVYKTNKEKFKVISIPKIINHSRSEFHMYQFNPSKTNVKKIRIFTWKRL